MTSFSKSVRRVTLAQLDGSFGKERGRELVVSLADGDIIIFRAKGTRHQETLTAADAYRYAVRCRANKAALEKSREHKQRKHERLAALHQARAEKKLFKPANQNERTK